MSIATTSEVVPRESDTSDPDTIHQWCMDSPRNPGGANPTVMCCGLPGSKLTAIADDTEETTCPLCNLTNETNVCSCYYWS